ncbi:hypothetical protein BGZ63DRAFT_24201 [Mariannaea sp. PMI_226]|nr:hypothetical protein BGZ63DRAFT_24201 [Mariannaea sp. PMI_226]
MASQTGGFDFDNFERQAIQEFKQQIAYDEKVLDPVAVTRFRLQHIKTHIKVVKTLNKRDCLLQYHDHPRAVRDRLLAEKECVKADLAWFDSNFDPSNSSEGLSSSSSSSDTTEGLDTNNTYEDETDESDDESSGSEISSSAGNASIPEERGMSSLFKHVFGQPETSNVEEQPMATHSDVAPAEVGSPDPNGDEPETETLRISEHNDGLEGSDDEGEHEVDPSQVSLSKVNWES